MSKQLELYNIFSVENANQFESFQFLDTDCQPNFC